MTTTRRPWPPNIELNGASYMVRPVTSDQGAQLPDGIFIFEEDGSPVLTVRGTWTSYTEALEMAERQLKDHVAPPPIDVFGGH